MKRQLLLQKVLNTWVLRALTGFDGPDQPHLRSCPHPSHKPRSLFKLSPSRLYFCPVLKEGCFVAQSQLVTVWLCWFGPQPIGWLLDLELSLQLVCKWWSGLWYDPLLSPWGLSCLLCWNTMGLCLGWWGEMCYYAWLLAPCVLGRSQPSWLPECNWMLLSNMDTHWQK